MTPDISSVWRGSNSPFCRDLPPKMILSRLNESLGPIQKLDKYGVYGYQPSQVGAGIFTAVYAICCILITFIAIKHRRWWMLPTLSLGAALECSGNAIRIYSHFNSKAVNAYIAQEVLLVITPAFIAAAHFTILSKICILFGPEYIKPIKANWLIPFFVCVDVASMAVQGAGSGIAAISEINNESIQKINSNGYIVAGGLAVQLAGYLAFNCLFGIFIYRMRKNPPNGYSDSNEKKNYWNGRMQFFLAATYISALFILGRSIFRTVEMSTGWIGRISTTEWYYLAFDATFVSVALIILTLISPANYMPRELTTSGGTRLPIDTEPSSPHPEKQEAV